MASAIDLRPDHRKTVEDILRDRLPDGVQVWVFGSRADWTSKDSSDLDLALEGDGPLDTGTVMALELAFEESLLPFNVDVVDLKRTEDGFRQRVLMTRTPLMSGEATVSRTGATSPGTTKIPTGWSKAVLSDVVDIVLSSVDKKTVDGETPVRLCNYTDVYYNQFIRTGMTFMEATATEREIGKCRLEPGDVVITKDSEKYDDIGVPSLVRDQFDDLICGYHLGILRSRPRTHGPFLFYAVSAKDVQEQFHSFANGITRFGLRKHDIGLVEVRLPSFTEQRAVAGVLAELDDRIELSRRMHATLEAMARALFKSWFVDFDPVRAKMERRDPKLPSEIADLFPDRLVESELGEIPEGWTAVPLADVMDINPSRSLPKGMVAPYLDMASIPTRGHIPQKIRRRTSGSGSRFRNGDTLVARITPCLENGKTAFVNCLKDGEVAWGSTEFIVLRPRPPVPNELAYCIARTSRFREYAIRSMTGTSGRQRVQTRAIAQFVVARATPSIYAAFRDAVHVLFSNSTETERSSRVAASLRDNLLPKLVSGEVRLPATLVERHAEPDVRVGP